MYIVLQLMVLYILVNNAFSAHISIFSIFSTFSTFSTFFLQIWLAITGESGIMFWNLFCRVIIWLVLAIPTIVVKYQKTGNNKCLIGVTRCVVWIDAVGIVLGYALYFMVEGWSGSFLS
jgi:hypothetical protein